MSAVSSQSLVAGRAHGVKLRASIRPLPTSARQELHPPTPKAMEDRPSREAPTTRFQNPEHAAVRAVFGPGRVKLGATAEFHSALHRRRSGWVWSASCRAPAFAQKLRRGRGARRSIIAADHGGLNQSRRADGSGLRPATARRWEGWCCDGWTLETWRATCTPSHLTR